MKNIHNIVASELILRTNNHNLKQEFGEVGISSNIISTSNSTVFTTVFSVHKVNYVTVNGINLIEGVHYEKISDNKISISNSGAPVKKNPSITTTVLVSYYAGHKISFITKVPPVINLFSLNKYSGKNGEIVFNFSISQFDGKNVYWSILKDGSSTPLYSGNTLFTTNGVSNNGTASVKLNHFISPTEYNSRKGQSIPFTFVVIYDLSENGERLDEKLISTAVYKLDTADNITGSLSVSPELIQAANSNNKVTISYQLNRPDTTASFDWAIFKSINGGAEIIIKQGNHASPVLSGSIEESFSTSAGDSFETRYFLRVKDVGAIEYITTLANDKIVIQIVDTTVPVITLIGSNPQSITIGSDYVELGATATDLQDGNISSGIVINSSAVNTGIIGSYSVTYNVSNSNGKNAVQVTRTVNIVAVVVPPLSSPKVYYGQVISGTSINQALVDLITPDNSAYLSPSVRAFRQEIATGITTSYSLFWDGNSPNADKNTQFIAIPSSSHVLNSVNSDAFGGENYHTNGGATVYSSSTAVLNGVNYTVYKYASIAPSNSNLTISITNN